MAGATPRHPACGGSYGDIGARGERATLNLSIGAGSNALGGNGPAPVQLLAGDRRSVFTYPDRTYNRMVTLQARGTYELPRPGAWKRTPMSAASASAR